MDWKKALNVLAQFEGLRTKAYRDQVGVWTIGIGSTYIHGRPVQKGDKISEKEAYEIAELDAQHRLEAITKLIKVPQTENQMIAILSLVYNIGITGFTSSSALKSINAKHSLETIEANWKKWNKGHIKGKLVVLKDLTIRRTREWKIYSGQTNP